MVVHCPDCNETMEKARLDVYWCYGCGEAYLIHKLSTYKTFEEAEKTIEDAWVPDWTPPGQGAWVYKGHFCGNALAEGGVEDEGMCSRCRSMYCDRIHNYQSSP